MPKPTPQPYSEFYRDKIASVKNLMKKATEANQDERWGRYAALLPGYECALQVAIASGVPREAGPITGVDSGGSQVQGHIKPLDKYLKMRYSYFKINYRGVDESGVSFHRSIEPALGA